MSIYSANAARNVDDANQFYYNGSLSAGATGVQATYVDNKTVPVLTDSTGWNVALARFNLNGAASAYPLWLANILTVPATSAGNDSIPVIGLIKNTFQYSMAEGIVVGLAGFTSGATTMTVVAQSVQNLKFVSLDGSNGAYSFSEFASSFSAAIAAGVKAITPISFAGYTITIPTDSYPTVTFDPSSLCFNLNVPVWWSNWAAGGTSGTSLYLRWFIGVNSTLANRISFPLSTWNSPADSPNTTLAARRSDYVSLLSSTFSTYRMLNLGMASQIPSMIQYITQAAPGAVSFPDPLIFTPTGYTGASAVSQKFTDGPGFFSVASGVTGFIGTLTQENSTVAQWTPYTGLAITTNSIPALVEMVGTGDNVAVTNVTQPILFDFQFVSAGDTQAGVSLTPNFYREAKLTGQGFSSIQLQFWLVTRNGSLQPFVLAPFSSMSFKLAFTKRQHSYT
jgi:hypothetical protein